MNISEVNALCTRRDVLKKELSQLEVLHAGHFEVAVQNNCECVVVDQPLCQIIYKEVVTDKRRQLVEVDKKLQQVYAALASI